MIEFLRSNFYVCSGGFGGRQPPNRKTIEFTPRPSATASPRTVFNLWIYGRLHKGVTDPVSFTVTTGLLGRLGLGLRVWASIRFIFTFLYFIINLLQTYSVTVTNRDTSDTCRMLASMTVSGSATLFR